MGEFVRELIKTRYSPQRIAKDIMWTMQDASQLLRVLPRQIKRVMSRLVNDEMGFKIDIPNLEKINLHNVNSRYFLSFSVMVSSIILASTLLVVNNVGDQILGLSAAGIIGYAIGGGLFLVSVVLFKK